MNKLHNTIALRYKQSVVIDNSNGKTLAIHIRALLLDISQLGYTLSGDVVRAVRTLTETEFKQFHTMLVENLKVMVGANVKYRALFKNFPIDIPDDEEYFFKRVVGYVTNLFDLVPKDIKPLSCGHVIDTRLFNLDEYGACPICQCQVDELDDETDRPVLEDITPLKIINLISEEDVKQIFTNLVAAKSSISEDNHAIIKQLIKEDPSMFTYVPAVIPMKENLALIAAVAVKYKYSGSGNDYTKAASDILVKNIKTATDVLRLAVQLNDGDVSLAEHTRIKLKNSERRMIMRLLNKVRNPEEDMLRYRMRWIRLAEVLHIGKYAKQFPNAFKAVDTLRNKPETIKTFNSEVEELVMSINNCDFTLEEDLIKLLERRPGEFARRLDWMLRNFVFHDKEVLNSFGNLLHDLSTSMLLTLSAHFTIRSINSSDRYFMPKGNLAKIQVIEDNRKTINSKIVEKVVKMIRNDLLARFALLDNLGDVYINKNLKNYLVPLVQRNASKSLVTIARGSRVPLMETQAVRMFIYWKQNTGDRTDLDLSAISYDSEWNYKNHISYTNLSDVGGKHSGDIQSAPNGAAEFIDIDIATARNNGVRYVVMNVISFTNQPFDTLQKCFAGVMERDKVNSGKKFEPKTVINKFDVGGNTKYNIPLILDLETNQIIWADIAMTSSRHSNVEGSGSIVAMSKAVESMNNDKPNMFDLLQLHASVRADSIDYDRQAGKKYDTVFDLDMASNVDEVLSKWL